MSAMTVRDHAFPPDHAPSTRDRRATARARWRLRATRADIAEFGPVDAPELEHVAEELDLLELADAARP
ncbi:hypothetical protein [Nocardiopsis halotolerans]|uniref:hypothetical protein n=1 Tax=Nocardiopsis halotolerans TaxID=124252 RepID=UPI00034D9521|nr:hypothetical protein [Nocardiopsis halotolerans]